MLFQERLRGTYVRCGTPQCPCKTGTTITVECICAGHGCEVCGERGYTEEAGCLRERIGPWERYVCQAVALLEAHMAPYAGPWTEWPADFIDAMSIVRGEMMPRAEKTGKWQPKAAR